MALTLDQAIQITREIMAADNSAFNFSKVDIRAAIDAADAWATSNAASYNSALPTAFRTGASTSQKALLLAYVCLRRAGL